MVVQASDAMKVTPAMSALAGRFTLNQVMLRVRDPRRSVPFYEKHFAMRLIEKRDFSDFSLYFLVTVPPGTPPDVYGREYLKSGDYGCCLELTHNHGTENDPEFSYHAGNTPPLGFGHLGFLVDDLSGQCHRMIGDGVRFDKEPSKGCNYAFAVDPDGYRVEVLQRSGTPSPGPSTSSFHHAMLRVADIARSLEFYQKICGFHLLHATYVPGERYWSYYLGSGLPPTDHVPDEAARTRLFSYPGQLLELTIADEPEVKYHNGNVDPRGFGHLAIMVDDVYEACAEMERCGVAFQKKPDDGRMKGLAFILDPDGYWIEVVKRGAN